MTARTQNLFSEFTNLYSLSKTLRFELKPVSETEELLKKTNLQGKTPIQVDQEIDELYHKEMKPLFDKLHEKFISEALTKVTFKITDLEQLEKKYLELKSLNKDKKNNSAKIKKLIDNKTGEIPKLENRLREIIVEQFDKLGEAWKEKYREINLNDVGSKILTNAKILDVLLILYPEKSEFIEKFQGFFTYFSGFNQNRENYYTKDSKVTGVANRIINKNYFTFLENKQKFKEIVKKIPDLIKYKRYFELENYQNYLTQEGIENYNEIIGGIILENGEKQQGVNEKVNLFCQQENQNFPKSDKKIFLPHLVKLQKQIGCRTKQQKGQEDSGKSIYPEYLEKVGLGFQITKNEAGKYQIWEALEHITKKLKPKLEKLQDNYHDFFKNWQEYKLDEIWFRKESINTISSRWFGGDKWAVFAKALDYLGTGKIEKGEYKTPPFINLQDLKNAVEALEVGINFDIKRSKRRNNHETSIKDIKKFSYTAENLFRDCYKPYFKTCLFETLLAVWQHEINCKFMQILDGYTDEDGKFAPAFLKVFEKQRKEPFDKNQKDTEKSIHVEVVKNLVEEGYLRLFQLTKYHNLEKKGETDVRPVENKFYNVLNEFWEENQIVIYHKAFQSTLTKKPYSEDKIKLNFENGSLLGGFSDGQEKNKAGVILQKGDKHFLGILLDRGFFRTDKANSIYRTENNAWQRLILTNLKFQTLAGKGFLGKYGISYGDLGKTNPMEAVRLLQEFIKDRYLHEYPQLQSVANKHFQSKKNFDVEIKKGLIKCFTMNFVPISKDNLQQGLKENKLYLFEITNKDFSSKTIGKNKNIHTLYWQQLFQNENLLEPILALNGGAEVFFRKGQKEKLDKKIDKSGKEVLNNKRYGEDKYFLHVSITINYGKPKNIKYRELVNQKIKTNLNNIKIIGIDRGEKNLLYYSVVDTDGRLIDQGSLNRIRVSDLVDEKEVKAEYENGDIKSVEFINTRRKVNYIDYQVLLDYFEKKRILARKSWEVIGRIKDLKEGYLSQAIHRIYQLIIEHNAIVVMEDLNREFKAKRTAKVEKSVYKKFELALARKLNHLILKDKKPNESGSVLNAYQLTPYIEAGKIGNFEKAKQWGILFYIRANYTSTTDPLTGWRKHKYVPNSETEKKIQEFFKPDDGVQINYDLNKKCFKFSYKDENRTFWHLFTFNGLERFYWNNKDRKMERYNLYEKFEELFSGLDKSKNINKQIYNKDFNWKRLVFLWNLLNQIRNIDREKTGNDNDFLQSPVWLEKHQQSFDSRKIRKKNLPENGDANGAYNIARKGAMLLHRIKNCPDVSKFGNGNNGKNPENSYYIYDLDWDKYVLQASF